MKTQKEIFTEEMNNLNAEINNIKQHKAHLTKTYEQNRQILPTCRTQDEIDFLSKHLNKMNQTIGQLDQQLESKRNDLLEIKYQLGKLAGSSIENSGPSLTR